VNFDGEKLEIECPECKRKFKKSVRELKRPGVKCPGCGVSFDTSQFKREIDKAERSIKDFERSIKNMKF
jgi:peptide subunit release factor 1 (eRF1)